jgi:hypothetical protein
VSADAQQDPYVESWTSPGSGSGGSMPLGNGDLAANVWAEPSGEICLYLAKSDARSENCRLLKLGRVRLSWLGGRPLYKTVFASVSICLPRWHTANKPKRSNG